MAHTSFILDKQGYITHPHVHAPARGRMHASTHTKICTIYWFCTATMIRICLHEFYIRLQIYTYFRKMTFKIWILDYSNCFLSHGMSVMRKNVSWVADSRYPHKLCISKPCLQQPLTGHHFELDNEVDITANYCFNLYFNVILLVKPKSPSRFFISSFMTTNLCSLSLSLLLSLKTAFRYLKQSPQKHVISKTHREGETNSTPTQNNRQSYVIYSK